MLMDRVVWQTATTHSMTWHGACCLLSTEFAVPHGDATSTVGWCTKQKRDSSTAPRCGVRALSRRRKSSQPHVASSTLPALSICLQGRQFCKPEMHYTFGWSAFSGRRRRSRPPAHAERCDEMHVARYQHARTRQCCKPTDDVALEEHMQCKSPLASPLPHSLRAAGRSSHVPSSALLPRTHSATALVDPSRHAWVALRSQLRVYVALCCTLRSTFGLLFLLPVRTVGSLMNDLSASLSAHSSGNSHPPTRPGPLSGANAPRTGAGPAGISIGMYIHVQFEVTLCLTLPLSTVASTPTELPHSFSPTFLEGCHTPQMHATQEGR